MRRLLIAAVGALSLPAATRTVRQAVCEPVQEAVLAHAPTVYRRDYQNGVVLVDTDLNNAAEVTLTSSDFDTETCARSGCRLVPRGCS
jgi:hypothetical protein